MTLPHLSFAWWSFSSFQQRSARPLLNLQQLLRKTLQLCIQMDGIG